MHLLIKREKKTKNYVVYVETEKYWYCLLHKDGDFTSSDSQSTCATTNRLPPGDDTCVDITNKGLGLNEEQYKGLRYGCTGATTGKRNLRDLQDDGTDTVIDLSTSSQLYLKLYSDCNKFTIEKKTKKEIDCNQYYDKYINYSIKQFIKKNNKIN